MNFREALSPFYYISQFRNFVFHRLWHILHFIIDIYYFVVGIACVLESHLYALGYKAFNPDKVRYLAIVVESEDAYQTSIVIKLLIWLKAIGVKHICLYDAEGVLKKSKDVILQKLKNVTLFEKAAEKDQLVSQNCMTLEFASFSDGKADVVKAANLLFENYMKLADLDGCQAEKIFSEAYMSEALKAIGCNWPEPDLLLIYGPARCHLGFPAWRIRYTEIVHMGSLADLRYGSLVKAIYKFTMVRQNYGK